MARVDLESLPIDSPVLELTRQDQRWRVTFTELAGIYWLDEELPGAAVLLEYLRSAKAGGTRARVSYRLRDKVLTAAE